MFLTDRLLELQSVDTIADQLRHRVAHLPELAAAKQAHDAIVEWERTRAGLRARLEELEGVIEAAEAEAAEIDVARTRLEGQLKTVIAPREAEALQQQLRTLAERRNEIDERELAALEEQSEVDDALVAHVAVESALREAGAASDGALAVVQADLATELADLERRRGELDSQLDETTRARYRRLRDHLGVAVARLVGHRCDGCHMDLSAAEVDLLKAVPVDELAECPQCTRILVR